MEISQNEVIERTKTWKEYIDCTNEQHETIITGVCIDN